MKNRNNDKKNISLAKRYLMRVDPDKKVVKIMPAFMEPDTYLVVLRTKRNEFVLEVSKDEIQKIAAIQKAYEIESAKIQPIPEPIAPDATLATPSTKAERADALNYLNREDVRASSNLSTVMFLKILSKHKIVDKEMGDVTVIKETAVKWKSTDGKQKGIFPISDEQIKKLANNERMFKKSEGEFDSEEVENREKSTPPTSRRNR